ncbi:hypothetical protein AAHC03_01073 [Spirometra sp. Aus1]
MLTARNNRFLFCITFILPLLPLGLTAPVPVDPGRETGEGGGLMLGKIWRDVEPTESTAASTSPLPVIASQNTKVQTTTSPNSGTVQMATTLPNTASNSKQAVKPASLVSGARMQTDGGNNGNNKAAVQMDYEIALGNNEEKKVAKIEKLFGKINDYLVCTYEDQKDCDERLLGKNQKETKLMKTATEVTSDTRPSEPKRPVYWWERKRGKNQAPVDYLSMDYPRALHDEPLGGVLLHPGRRFPSGSSVYRPVGHYGSPYPSFAVSHHKPVYVLRNGKRGSRRNFGHHWDHTEEHPGLDQRPYSSVAGFRRRGPGIDDLLHRGTISERELKNSLLEIKPSKSGERLHETRELPQKHKRHDWKFGGRKTRANNNENFLIDSHGWGSEHERSPFKPADNKFIAQEIPYGRQGQQAIFHGHFGKPTRMPEFREEMLRDFWPENHLQGNMEEEAVRQAYASRGSERTPFWSYRNAYPPQNSGIQQSPRMTEERQNDFKDDGSNSYEDGWKRWARKMREKRQ